MSTGILGMFRQAVGGAVGSFNAEYIPRFARQLSVEPQASLLVVRGWFAHGRFGLQRDPWTVVEVRCDDSVVGVLTESWMGNRSRIVHRIRPGPHQIAILGHSVDDRTPTILFDRRLEATAGCVSYIAFVPPRPNPFVRRAKPKAKWFCTTWTST